MGESNTQSEAVVRKFFELLNAEDLEGVRALLTEEAAWVPQARDMPGAGEYRGRNVIVDEFLKPIRGLFAKGSPSNRILSMASNGFPGAGRDARHREAAVTAAPTTTATPGPSKCAPAKWP